MRKRKWLKRAIFIVVPGWLLFACVLSMVIYVYGTVDERQPADVIIVLGAGLKENGNAGPALTRRSNLAADLWAEGIASHIICTGTQAEGYPRSEAVACQEILLGRGIPDSMIILEERSRSTEENALYTHEFMDAQGWQTAVMVSDSYHMLRAHWLFTTQGIQVLRSPVPAARISSPISYLYFIAREVAALHWQVIKSIFRLPVTHVYGV